MPHLNDLKKAAFKAAIVTTSENIDDLEIEWLQVKGATSDHVNDAWLEVFGMTLTITATGNFNDDAYAYLGSLGHAGAINERWVKFYSGALP